MYRTTIVAGDKQVLCSGTVISFDNSPITIEMFDDCQSVVKLQFIFNNDEAIEGESMSTAVIEDTLCFTLTNFNNPIGTGNTAPISFAKYKKLRLYLQFRVTSLNDVDRTLYYTIYADGGECNDNI